MYTLKICIYISALTLIGAGCRKLNSTTTISTMVSVPATDIFPQHPVANIASANRATAKVNKGGFGLEEDDGPADATAPENRSKSPEAGQSDRLMQLPSATQPNTWVQNPPNADGTPNDQWQYYDKKTNTFQTAFTNPLKNPTTTIANWNVKDPGDPTKPLQWSPSNLIYPSGSTKEGFVPLYRLSDSNALQGQFDQATGTWKSNSNQYFQSQVNSQSTPIALSYNFGQNKSGVLLKNGNNEWGVSHLNYGSDDDSPNSSPFYQFLPVTQNFEPVAYRYDNGFNGSAGTLNNNAVNVESLFGSGYQQRLANGAMPQNNRPGPNSVVNNGSSGGPSQPGRGPNQPGSGQVQIVKVGAPWCGPCQVMDGVLGRIQGYNSSQQINGDNNRDLVRKYGVQSYPALLAIQNGEVIGRYDGGHTDQARIQAFYDKYNGR